MELAGLSTRAVYRAIQRGELRAVRLCSRPRITHEDFDGWIARSVVAVERTPIVGTRLVPATRGSFRRLLGDILLGNAGRVGNRRGLTTE